MTPPSPAPTTLRLLGAILAVQILFAIHYPVSKVLVSEFPPLVWALIRSVGATVMLLVFAAVARPRSRPALTARFLALTALFALLGNVINQAGYLVGIRYTTTTNSAVLNTSIPVFTLLTAWLAGYEKLRVRQIAALWLAAAGAWIVIGAAQARFGSETLKGDLLTLGNAFSHSIFLVFARDYLARHDRVWATAWLFLMGTIGLAVLALPDLAGWSPPPLTAPLVAAGVFSIVGATFFTYLFLNWVLTWWPASRVSLFIYLQPILATWIGIAWLGESLTVGTVAGSLLLFLGVGLTLAPAARDQAAIFARTLRRNSAKAPSEGTR